ncbi:hypothetical protein JI739_21845 [Ramlibacter sp. AW1]|uniref:Uncharacterized protein n=1 Tax=Ramlibacter aurantiacus TaxID=2801330 RepID=A0A936ZSU0_9BURK|nr:hypothetical protein [Ramlibacter aurantiacus]
MTVIDPQTGAGGYLIEGGARGGWLIVAFVIAVLVLAGFVLVSLLMAGMIGLPGFLIGMVGLVGAYIDLLSELAKVESADDFNRLLSLTALRGFSSLVLMGIGAAFYASLQSVAGLSQLTPFSLLNAALLLMTGWFI